MWEEILEKVKAFLLHDQNNRMKIKKKVVVDERFTGRGRILLWQVNRAQANTFFLLRFLRARQKLKIKKWAAERNSFRSLKKRYGGRI